VFYKFHPITGEHMPRLTPDQLAALAAIDSPTVANAIERFRVRRRVDGYADRDLRCAFPHLGTMAGYAVTCTADSTKEGRADGAGLIGLWSALEAAPRPAVLVIKDVGPDPRRGCHMGEIMATTAKALGAVGCVSDGGLRDVREVEALGGFHYFCPGFVVSHGQPVILDVNVPVEVHGLSIEPGDLLHGDVNGLLVVPEAISADVAAACAEVRREERALLDLITTPGFTVEKLRQWTYSH
jgi:4-hydroxy-4-methyl-2-oxoglutarate aldolase